MESRRRVQAAAAKPKANGQPAAVLTERAAPGPGKQRETAEYLADMILELRNLARSNQLYTVMVPLAYAYYEAFGAANRVEIPQSEIDRIKNLSRTYQELEKVPNSL